LAILEFAYTAMAKSTREIKKIIVVDSGGTSLEEGIKAGQCFSKETLAEPVLELIISRAITLNIKIHKKFATGSAILLKTSCDKIVPMERKKSQLTCVAMINIRGFCNPFPNRYGRMKTRVLSSSKTSETIQCIRKGT